jgi:transposase-like protein
MSPKKRKHYTEEFKAQVVELLGTGKPVSEVAEEMCVSSSLLYKWRRVLSRENAILRQENEILKKAAIILGTRARSSSER